MKQLLFVMASSPSLRDHAQKQPGKAHTDLAHEWFNFRHNVLYQRVINKIQSARASKLDLFLAESGEYLKSCLQAHKTVPFSVHWVHFFDRT